MKQAFEPAEPPAAPQKTVHPYVSKQQSRFTRALQPAYTPAATPSWWSPTADAGGPAPIDRYEPLRAARPAKPLAISERYDDDSLPVTP